MTTKHTPGPWNAILGPTQIVTDGKVIADVSHALKEHSEAYANARLIAAAPELLTLLKSFVHPETQWAPDWLDHFANMARQAIAKAEGGNSHEKAI